MPTPIIVVAGATGALGGRIARALIQRGAVTRAIVRKTGKSEQAAALREIGVTTIEADFSKPAEIAKACDGAACVVSALSGLRDVIVGAQSCLLDGALAAGVPRFIPSDYAIDFTKLPEGSNRNLDLRREFRGRLDRAPIAATSILNGMFTELLTGPAPIILDRFHRILYWEDADQVLDLTTMDDAARFTARAAVEPSTPRNLRIAGDQITARQLAAIVSRVTGSTYKLLRGGSLHRLSTIVALTKMVAPGGESLYPAWQGMQYLGSMFSGLGELAPLDNGRYPDMTWTSVESVLTAHYEHDEPSVLRARSAETGNTLR